MLLPGMQNRTTALKKQLVISQKVNHTFIKLPRNLTSRQAKASVYTNNMYVSILTVLFIAQSRNNSNACSVYITKDYYSAIKRSKQLIHSTRGMNSQCVMLYSTLFHLQDVLEKQNYRETTDRWSPRAGRGLEYKGAA